MRLTAIEIQNIKQCASDVFGKGSKVILFGSRIDDSKKGGDIDLFIEPQQLTDAVRQKVEFISKVQLCLGYQKIDVIIARDPSRRIEQEARKHGKIL